MSAASRPLQPLTPPVEDLGQDPPDTWADVTPEQRAELDRRCADINRQRALGLLEDPVEL